MNRLNRVTGVLALLLSTPALVAGPARADDVPVNTWLTCEGVPPTTGTLTGFHAFNYDEARHRWRSYITGTIAPCPTPGPPHVFAVAAYDSDGHVQGWALRYPGDGAGFYGYVEVGIDTTAVCAIRSVKDRLDCVKINWIPQDTGPPLPTAGGPIPTDSPDVTVDAKVDLTKVYAVDPGCPTCVDD